MQKLFKIELGKILPNRSFKILFGLYVGIFSLFFIAIPQANVFKVLSEVTRNNQINPFEFPDIWVMLSYTAQFFTVLLAILIIVLVCNEFLYRTARQHVIDGLSRLEFTLGKLMNVIIIAALSTIAMTVIGLLSGIFQGSGSSNIAFGNTIPYLFALFVQIAGFLSLAMFLGFLLKKTGMAIVLFMILFTSIPNWFFKARFSEEIAEKLPISIFWGLTQFDKDLKIEAIPNANITDLIVLGAYSNFILAFVYIAVFTVLSYLLLLRSDLK